MIQYESKTFSLPALNGISAESVKQHFGLYEGYVKNFNGRRRTARAAFEEHLFDARTRLGNPLLGSRWRLFPKRLHWRTASGEFCDASCNSCARCMGARLHSRLRREW